VIVDSKTAAESLAARAEKLAQGLRLYARANMTENELQNLFTALNDQLDGLTIDRVVFLMSRDAETRLSRMTARSHPRIGK
jgi:hypothetical protein